MKYQVRYNTDSAVSLTQLLIYLLDNKEVTYESFKEVSTITSSTFSKLMNTLKDMIDDLNMKIVLSKTSYLNTEIDTNQLKTNKYFLTTLGEDKYHYEIDNLDDNLLIKYSMPIVYLMLKQHKYIKYEKLSNIFPNLRRDTLITLIEKLQSILLDEITKNEINSYVLINE